MKNESTEKILEEISLSNTTSDLWDELYKNSSHNVILSFIDGTGYKLRLLGHFMHGSRMFLSPNLNFQEYMNSKELYQVLKGDDEVIKDIIVKRIINKAPDATRKKLHVESIQDIKGHSMAGKKIYEAVAIINNLYSKTQWQPIVFSNAIVLDSSSTLFSAANPSVICLSKNLCYQILREIFSISKNREDASKKKISGLYAHDIMIARQGTGINSKYAVRLSKQPSHLPSSLISFILKEGLWDITKIIKTANKKTMTGNMSGFIYRVGKNYKMSSALMTEIFEQAQEIDDAAYMDSVEEQINDLPRDAFENYINENTIGSLEL
jgi:hypothetical protein